MSRKFRTAIVGAGFMGQTHGKNWAMRPNVEVVAVCDIARTHAEALRGMIGAHDAIVYDDFDTMLDHEVLDAIAICIPPFAHSGQVEKAAARGIHLFLEKPIALDLVRAESQVAAIEKAGVVSQVGFHFRFRKSVEKMKALIAAGNAGKAVLFTGRYWCNMLGGAWWRDRSMSGGQIIEQVIHIYDMAMHLFGEVESVHGQLANITKSHISDYSIEDTSVGIIKFRNGAKAVITGCNAAIEGHFFGDWRVVSEYAMLDYRCTGQPWVEPDTASVFYHPGADTERTNFIEDADAYAAETADFFDAIEEGRPTRTPARDALNALRAVLAIGNSV